MQMGGSHSSPVFSGMFYLGKHEKVIRGSRDFVCCSGQEIYLSAFFAHQRGDSLNPDLKTSAFKFLYDFAPL
jgi:hypothetical protein